MGVKLNYRSLDVAKNIVHDYTSIDEINEKFDIITLFEIREHC